MAVDQAFIIQQIMNKDVLYAAFCVNTKMPFIICDPETFNDQVWIFDKEEVLKKFVDEYAAKKYIIRGAKMEKKQFAGFFASLYTIDVNEIVYAEEDSKTEIALTALVKRPDFSKLPVVQRPIENPSLQLAGLYFMQEATRQIPNDQKQNLSDLNEEFSANLASARYILAVIPKEGEGSLQEKLAKRQFTVPVLNMKNGKKFVPCFSDQFEFDKFRRGAKLLEVAVPLPGLLQYHGDGTDGFMLNPMGMSMTLTNDLIEAVQKAFPERVQMGVQNAVNTVKEAQDQMKQAKELMQKAKAAKAARENGARKQADEQKRSEIPVSHLPGHSKVLTPFAQKKAPQKPVTPAPVYRPVKKTEKPEDKQ